MCPRRYASVVLLGAVLVGCDESPGRLPTPDQTGRLDLDLDRGALERANSDRASRDTSPEPPLVEKSFTPSDEEILNPERGLHDEADLVAGQVPGARTNGMTLVRAYVRLDAYRTSAIDSQLLIKLGAGFDKLRAAGLKVVLRFAYNFGIGEADASRTQILAHLAQLKPLLTQHADVIALLQAGFIGAWGEWHSSTNGLDNDTDRKAILDGILAALPASRMVQVRTPMYKKNTLGGPLPAAQAFDGTLAARVGHHNDCFLASDTDAGTYASPIATWKSFVADEGRFLVVGGETCKLNSPRSDCPTAKAELEQLHWSYLNLNYHQQVIQSWQTQGCFAEIKRRLGYRLALSKAGWSERVRPGGVLAVSFTLHNSGYASLYNERPVYVVLDDGTTRLAAKLAKVDPRRIEAGQSTSVAARLRLPASIKPGSYALALWLPDPANGLKDRSEYAVRLASIGVWSEARSHNVLAAALAIDADAPGSVDPTASVFEEIP